MYKDEIMGKSWTVSPDLKVRLASFGSIGTIEQENHINVLKSGYTNPDEKEIIVTCSFPEWITHYSKSEYFTLQEVLVSTNERNKGFVLEIKGVLEYSGLTIRKKKHSYTPEELIARSERMRSNIMKSK